MSAFTDAVAARYIPRESETDVFGRVIEVRRLRPADSFWVRQIADSDLTDVATEALIASSVSRITDAAGKQVDLNPPRNAQELSARLDYLEAEGMTAAMTAYARLMGAETPQSAKGDSAGEGQSGTADGNKIADPVTRSAAGASEASGKRSRRERQPVQQAAE